MRRDRLLFGVALVLGALVAGALLWPGSPLARQLGVGEARELVLRVDNVGQTPVTARIEVRDDDARAIGRAAWEAPPGRSERAITLRLAAESFAWGRFSGPDGQGDLIVAFAPDACPRAAPILVGWEIDPTRGMGVRGQTVGCVAD